MPLNIYLKANALQTYFRILTAVAEFTHPLSSWIIVERQTPTFLAVSAEDSVNKTTELRLVSASLASAVEVPELTQLLQSV